MRKSEIMDAFVKIAEEKGMFIDVEKHNKKIKELLEKNPRWDWMTAKEIAKLYDLKPETSEGMDYKRNIMEVAHPESVVIAPSYDPLNGLIENENERQDITINIIKRKPRGLNTNKKYAQDQLVKALIRTANDLDNRGNEELRVLADTCLEQVIGKKNALKKTAFSPAALLNPYTGVAALFGALYYQQHMDAVNQGFEENHNRLIKELDDFLNANHNFGIGQTYKPEFISMVSSFKEKLESFYNLYKQAETLISELERPHTPKEAMEAGKQFSNSAPLKAYEALKKGAVDVLGYARKIQENFGNESYKQRQIAEKGTITSLIDRMQVFHGGGGLIADDFDDVKQVIPAYIKSLEDVASLLGKAGTLESSLKRDLDEAKSTQEAVFKGSPENSGGAKEIDQKAGDLEKELPENLEEEFMKA